MIYQHVKFQETASPHTNGDHAALSNSASDIRENGSTNGDKVKIERPPSRSGSSSSRSTPSLKVKDVSNRVHGVSLVVVFSSAIRIMDLRICCVP